MMNVNVNGRRVSTRQENTSIADGSGPDFSSQRPSINPSVPWAARSFCERALGHFWVREPMLAQKVEYDWDIRSLLSSPPKPECCYELLNFDGNIVTACMFSAEETFRTALSNSPFRVYGILEIPLYKSVDAVSKLFIDRRGRHITLQS